MKNGASANQAKSKTGGSLRFIDGIVSSGQLDPVSQPVKTKPAHKPIPASKKIQEVSRAKNTRSRNKQRSQTLNRKVVKKPKVATQTKSNVVVKTQRHTHPVGRIVRAQSTERSPAVTKFGKAAGTTLIPKIVEMAPKPHQDHIPAPDKAPEAYVPKKRETSAQTVFQKHLDANLNTPAHTRHTKKKRSLTKIIRKPLVAAPGVMVALLITGFVVYQRVPDISMRVAASRAGFSANLPQTPVGFRIDGPISADNGRVSIRYASNSDERNLTLYQQPSTLDSTSLRNGYLDRQGASYQVVEQQGTTIFVLNNSEATWVNQGIWYSLEGDSQLSPQQIADLATSI